MISLQQVSKAFGDFQAVTDVSLHINKGEIYGIIGPSGAGKSTVLRLMNLLEVPTAGEVVIDGQPLTQASTKQLRDMRKSIGMIFQHFHLLGNKTIYANIAVALELAGVPKKQHAARVAEVLNYVGLSSYAKSYPAALSGGQKQRIAIARALVTNPKVLLCDEPTSALDTNTTSDLLHVLQKINADFGVTIVIVSHALDVIKSICQRVTVLDGGRVYETVDITPKGIQPVDHTPASFVRALKEADV
ncbi:MAG: ATP-binding cassette domain-containing protein [Solibacillus sp.]